MIFRVHRHERDFVLIQNGVFEDVRLSFKAKGVLGFLLSRPPTWQASSKQLARIGPDGRDGIRSALAELEERGYIRRERRQDEAGRWRTETHVYEVPDDVEVASPTPENPSSVRPGETHETPGGTEDGFTDAGESGPSSKTEGVRRRTPQDEPPAATSNGSQPTKTDPVADEVTRDAWERMDRKPLCGFPAVRVRAQEALDAGWPRDAVTEALVRTRAYTRDAIEFQLRGGRARASPGGRGRTALDAFRDLDEIEEEARRRDVRRVEADRPAPGGPLPGLEAGGR